jgi:hypothetical protein
MIIPNNEGHIEIGHTFKSPKFHRGKLSRCPVGPIRARHSIFSLSIL